VWIERIANGEQPVESVVQTDPEPGQLTDDTFDGAVNRSGTVVIFVCDGSLMGQFAEPTQLDGTMTQFPAIAFFAFYHLPELIDPRAKPSFVALFKNGGAVGTWRYSGKIELPDLLKIAQADELG
jgi:hypothetical protein